MQSFPRSRRPYPSDITEAQWRRIEPLIPGQKPRGRHRAIDLREVVNAIHYRWTTGCVWRMLPHDFPAWGTVYSYFRCWHRNGTLRQLRDQLLKPKGLDNRNTEISSRTDHQTPRASRSNQRITPRWLDNRPDRISNPRHDSERAA